MELYFTNTLISERILTSSSFISYGLQTPEGRLCDNRGYSLTLNIPYDILTVYFHTDGSGSGARGLNVSFTAIGKYF